MKTEANKRGVADEAMIHAWLKHYFYISYMEVINKNISYKVEVDDLVAGDYTAHLWDKAEGTIISATCTVLVNYQLATFEFSATDTATLNDGAVVALEIFNDDQNSIYYKERFARVRATSVES